MMLACWLAFVIVYDIDTGDCLYWYDEAKPHDIKPCGDETPFDYTKHKWIKPHGPEDQRLSSTPIEI
jgi:rubredoxin